jgi:hypothetical protein
VEARAPTRGSLLRPLASDRTSASSGRFDSDKITVAGSWLRMMCASSWVNVAGLATTGLAVVVNQRFTRALHSHCYCRPPPGILHRELVEDVRWCNARDVARMSTALLRDARRDGQAGGARSAEAQLPAYRRGGTLSPCLEPSIKRHGRPAATPRFSQSARAFSRGLSAFQVRDAFFGFEMSRNRRFGRGRSRLLLRTAQEVPRVNA